jgi:NAD(P)-dependent dehydrogenase (short-subunit alcohol dehydrogenase family)
VAYLLSEDARYITGAELHVDGAASRSRNSAAIALWDAGLES